MKELEVLGKVMNLIMDNCDKCPLEYICNDSCDMEWKNFFASKVKEDGIEERKE